MQLLWAVAHGLESASQRMHAMVGVTSPQRLVLRLIDHYGRAAPGDLADVLHVDPSSLTGVVRRLEQAGLIQRRADPRDGRRAILTLTPRGQKLNDQRVGTVEASVKRTLGSLTPQRVAVAAEVLGALARELDVEIDAAAPRRAAASVSRRPRQRPRARSAR